MSPSQPPTRSTTSNLPLPTATGDLETTRKELGILRNTFGALARSHSPDSKFVKIATDLQLDYVQLDTGHLHGIKRRMKKAAIVLASLESEKGHPISAFAMKGSGYTSGVEEAAAAPLSPQPTQRHEKDSKPTNNAQPLKRATMKRRRSDDVKYQPEGLGSGSHEVKKSRHMTNAFQDQNFPPTPHSCQHTATCRLLHSVMSSLSRLKVHLKAVSRTRVQNEVKREAKAWCNNLVDRHDLHNAFYSDNEWFQEVNRLIGMFFDHCNQRNAALPDLLEALRKLQQDLLVILHRQEKKVSQTHILATAVPIREYNRVSDDHARAAASIPCAQPRYQVQYPTPLRSSISTYPHMATNSRVNMDVDMDDSPQVQKSSNLSPPPISSIASSTEEMPSSQPTISYMLPQSPKPSLKLKIHHDIQTQDGSGNGTTPKPENGSHSNSPSPFLLALRASRSKTRQLRSFSTA